mmetsp:Transcript_29948/g.58772  ORF Transcript_29948/g.58772 Transcript_29948/m.58772 type:complete len:106 (-) Transcript_29948:109-426(-)
MVSWCLWTLMFSVASWTVQEVVAPHQRVALASPLTGIGHFWAQLLATDGWSRQESLVVVLWHHCAEAELSHTCCCSSRHWVICFKGNILLQVRCLWQLDCNWSLR